MGKNALHKLVQKDRKHLSAREKRQRVEELLAQRRPVAVELTPAAARSDTVLVDVAAIWRGFQHKRAFRPPVFPTCVVFPAEDDVAFRQCSPDTQRLLTSTAGRVQRLDRASCAVDRKGRLVVQVPADPDFRDKHGFTALYLAASRPQGGREEILALVQGSADPNAQIAMKEIVDGRLRLVAGDSPLIAAINAGNTQNVQILLSLGASTKQFVWANGSDGQTRQYTPLMYSSDKHHQMIKEEYIKHANGQKLLGGSKIWEEITALLANPTQTVVDFVAQVPELATVKNLSSCYVLHTICSLEGGTSCVEMARVIAAFPAAVLLMTCHRDLPLHLALREGSMEADVIDQLMQLPDGWQQGYDSAHKDDLVPAEARSVFVNPMLQFSDGSGEEEGEEGANENGLPKALHNGELARVTDMCGCLPLHLALRNCTSDVVWKVLNEFPEGAQDVDGDGDTCLRLALVRCKALAADSNEVHTIESVTADINLGQSGDTLQIKDDQATSVFQTAEGISDDNGLGHDRYGVGARHAPLGDDMIEALMRINSDAASQIDCDGRTALQLATELNVPAAQYKQILDANKHAAQKAFVRAKITLSVTVPTGLTEHNRDVIVKLPNHHTVHVVVPLNLNTGRVLRVQSRLDAKYLYLKISRSAQPGLEWSDTLSSGQEIKVTIPPLEQMRLHPSREYYWHPFELEGLEDIVFYVPISAEVGALTHVYTREGSYTAIIVPEWPRYRRSNRVPLVVRPGHPTHPDNVEHLLHAAISGATVDHNNEDMIAMLVEAYPKAAQCRNRYNMLPLHLLMICAATPKATMAVLDAYSKAASIKTDNGDLPLHILLHNAGVGTAVDVGVAEMILKAYPEALTQKDSRGNYPLHAALNKCGDLEAFVLDAMDCDLEGVSPAAIKTSEGDFPLHLAIENGSSVVAIRAIAEAHPKAIVTNRTDGTTNMSNLFILGDRRATGLTMPRLKQLCEIADIFFEVQPSLLTKRDGQDQMLHLVLNSQSADELVMTVVKAHHKAGNLQQTMLTPFNEGADVALCMMLEQDRGIKVIEKCLQLCDDVGKVMNMHRGSLPTAVMMQHCHRKSVANFILERHEQFCSADHQATPEQKLFLAARTGDAETVRKFVIENNVDFNAQDVNGNTAKEVAMNLGHTDAANLMPKAISSTVSKKAMIAEAAANGESAKKSALIKWHLQPFMVVAWCFLHYFDIYNDLTLTLKFGNVHFPPLNTVCGCNYVLFNPTCDSMYTPSVFESFSQTAAQYEGPCSTYVETGFFGLSMAFILMGVVAACLIDYFMMRSTESIGYIFIHWIMNLSLLRMFYEAGRALFNISHERMPQAGLSAVKAAEGLFESVPQLLLQAFILYRIVLEPLRPPAPTDAVYGTECHLDNDGRCTHNPQDVLALGEETGDPTWTSGLPSGNPWVAGSGFDVDASTACGADTFVTWTQLFEEAETGGGWGSGGMRAPDACVLPEYLWQQPGYSKQMIDYLNSTRDVTHGTMSYSSYNCTIASPYHRAHCDACPLTSYVEIVSADGMVQPYGECLSSVTIWMQLAVSVASGLLSTSSTIAMLPERVRVQWRVAFGLYIVCQVIFRVSALMMAATIFAVSARSWIFAVLFITMYSVQAVISRPRRVDIAKELLKQQNARALQKEIMQQRKMALSRVSKDYMVMGTQFMTKNVALSSPVVQVFDKYAGTMSNLKVSPGQRVRSVVTAWLPSGLQRVKIAQGWLSVQDVAGAIMLKPASGENTGASQEIAVGWKEKLWIGLLTIIVPVQFDTIKNIHKSNPREEATLSFVLRMGFNLTITAPFVYYYPLFGQNAHGVREVPHTYTQPWLTADSPLAAQSVWRERISVSRAHSLLLVTYVFGFASLCLYVSTRMITRRSTHRVVV